MADVETHVKAAKFGAPADLPSLKLRRLRGVKLTLEKENPRGLPSDAKTHYFALERDGHYWQNVVQEGEVAISDAHHDLRFSLYLVQPAETGGA